MGKRKIAVLQTAAIAIAEVAYFIECKGLPDTAKRFVDDVFHFFTKLSDLRAEHRLCVYRRWKELGYRCIVYKKSMSSLILARKKKLLFAILSPPNY